MKACVITLMADGGIAPVVAEAFPFERTPDAHRLIQERERWERWC